MSSNLFFTRKGIGRIMNKNSKGSYGMDIRIATIDDLPQLLDIYNYEVLNGVATFDIAPKTLEERTEWFNRHNYNNHPLIVAVIEGYIAGYASLSSYRDKEAYNSTVELSVYIAAKYRNQGVATTLMAEIIDMAQKNHLTHMIISVITAGNEGSRWLHEKFGFTFCGVIPEVGFKFGKYHSIENYSLKVQ